MHCICCDRSLQLKYHEKMHSAIMLLWFLGCKFCIFKKSALILSFSERVEQKVCCRHSMSVVLMYHYLFTHRFLMKIEGE
jgi:hypothetical protein